MHHVLGALIIGAVTGAVTGKRVQLRPAVRRVVKGGIIAKRKIQAIGATVVEETNKLVAEACAELDQAGNT